MLPHSYLYKPSINAIPEHLPSNDCNEEVVHRWYADWADKSLPVLGDLSPREAIQRAEGLEQVKFLLRTYERDETHRAKAQHYCHPVSYDLLWRELGITP
jgi:hypothetical protein